MYESSNEIVDKFVKNCLNTELCLGTYSHFDYRDALLITLYIVNLGISTSKII